MTIPVTARPRPRRMPVMIAGSAPGSRILRPDPPLAGAEAGGHLDQAGIDLADACPAVDDDDRDGEDDDQDDP